MDLQAQDRVHRIGQTKRVNVYRLVTENSIDQKVVERAEAKLYLDALIIQQGRLVEQNRGMSRDEMMSIIKFGADAIFSSSGGTITDEDINVILSRGEKETSKFSDKLKACTNDLLSFGCNDEEGKRALFPFSNLSL